MAQLLSCPGQARLDGSRGATDSPRCFFIALAFEITQNDGRTVLRRKPANFVVQGRAQVEVCSRIPGCFQIAKVLLVGQPLRALGAGFGGSEKCDTVQPVAEQLWPGDRTCFANEHQERRLEGVVGVVGVAEHTPADAQDHGPMPLNEQCERRAVAVDHELPQQLGIRENSGVRGASDLADVVNQLVHKSSSTGLRIPGGHTIVLPGRPGLRREFFQIFLDILCTLARPARQRYRGSGYTRKPTLIIQGGGTSQGRQALDQSSPPMSDSVSEPLSDKESDLSRLFR